MLHPVQHNKRAPEGYVYATYGHPKYLKHALASVVSLRRYDEERPVALVCTKNHIRILKEKGLEEAFDIICEIPPENASIIGFKHHIHKYLFFERNIFLDSDIIWCKNPDALWQSFRPYRFTITGTQVSDNFFGGPKGAGVVLDILLRRRQRTLKRFGLTYLSRVQSGLIYASDYDLASKVCKTARQMLRRKDQTHFRSRTEEQGRSEESCEWSLAMAMSKLKIPVYPWLQGHTSPQLDYVKNYTTHDADFEYVVCKYYCHKFVYNFRGIKTKWIRKLLTRLVSLFPGRGDYLKTTPYCLHFGWYHQKRPFIEFSERVWKQLESAENAGEKLLLNSKDRLAKNI